MHFPLILYFHLFVFHPHLSHPSLASLGALYAGPFPLPWKECCNISHLTKTPPLPHLSLQLKLILLFCFTPHTSHVYTGQLYVFSNSVLQVLYGLHWSHAGQGPNDSCSPNSPIVRQSPPHLTHQKHLTRLTVFPFLKQLLYINLVIPPLLWISIASLWLTPEIFLDLCQVSWFFKINTCSPGIRLRHLLCLYLLPRWSHPAPYFHTLAIYSPCNYL